MLLRCGWALLWGLMARFGTDAMRNDEWRMPNAE